MPYTPRFLRIATAKSAENTSPKSAESTTNPLANTGILSSSADIIALQNKAVLLRSGEMLNIHSPESKQCFDTASYGLETIARAIVSTLLSQRSSTLPTTIKNPLRTALTTIEELNKIPADNGLEQFFQLAFDEEKRKPYPSGERALGYHLTFIDATFAPFKTLMDHIVAKNLEEVFAVRVGDWDIDLPLGTITNPQKLAQLLPQSIANFKSYL
jgi:hypothetical protein